MVIDMKTLEIKTTDLKKLRKAMEKELHAKRYEHTLSVAYTAASLAMIHDVEPNKALIAGMLHDCAKCLSNKKLISARKTTFPYRKPNYRIRRRFCMQKSEAFLRKKNTR